MSTPLISARNLSFNYNNSPEEGLFGLDFDIYPGEIILLAGNSGSGKSTFLRCLNGLIPAVFEGELSGELKLNGQSYRELEAHQLARHIGSVFQNPRSQFFTNSGEQELSFPLENYGLANETILARVQELTRQYRLEDLLLRDIYELSGGERQRLALAVSLALEPQLLLFDEPSANLDYGQAMRLKSQIQDLRAAGKTVIVADHRFFYLSGILDRVFLMEGGRLRIFPSEAAFRASEYDCRSFDLFALPPLAHPLKTEAVPTEKQTVLALHGLGFKDVLRNLNFSLQTGEVSCLLGINGVGKSTLARLISGGLKPDSGSLQTPDLPLYLLQDADFQLFGSSVENELAIASHPVAASDIAEALEALMLSPLADKHPSELSGGQKQRLQFALALLSRKNLLIFDEPTSGLDHPSMRQLASRLHGLCQKAAVLVISHDYEFIRLVADRILYLENGRIDEDFLLDSDSFPKLQKIFKRMEALS